MTRLLMTGALAWFLTGGIAVAQDPAAPDASPQNSVKLTRVLADIPMGTPYMSLRIGITFCKGDAINQIWKDGRTAQKISPYQPPFKAELEPAGYKVVTPGETICSMRRPPRPTMKPPS
jgi:hypothetical protein